MTSSVNITRENQCALPRDLRLRTIDTLPNASTIPQAVTGSGKVVEGTMTSYPDPNPSNVGTGWRVFPSHVDAASHAVIADPVTHFSRWVIGIPRPTEEPPEMEGITDTVPLILRFYDITADTNTGFLARLSLRYDLSEMPAGTHEDSFNSTAVPPPRIY